MQCSGCQPSLAHCSWLALSFMARLAALACGLAMTPQQGSAAAVWSFTPKDMAHCLRWAKASDLAQLSVLEAVPAGGALCRHRPVAGNRTPANGSGDVLQHHLPVGVLDRASGRCLPSGGAPSGSAVEVAAVEQGCDVWWRYVSPDVFPPM